MAKYPKVVKYYECAGAREYHPNILRRGKCDKNCIICEERPIEITQRMVDECYGVPDLLWETNTGVKH